jgi:tetratricopeptide (TPR) repeat protein
MICLLSVGFDDTQEPGDARIPPVTERLGNYRIEHREDGTLWELGRGAMGVTYQALDTSLQRSVALKLIDAEWITRGAEARERFMREARAAASLRHPHVATVYQFGIQEESGQYFCAMELVEGETLEMRVRRAGPLNALTTVEIALQVTGALAAAEKQGLVHRDLKPANLMLVAADDETSAVTVKVIDFGVAKALAETPNEMGLTHGGFVGTPAFASPEQFTNAPVDVRSDIYSLGATLWYLLTGQMPFPGASVEQIRANHQLHVLPLNQLKTARVPSRLVALLRSMLEPEPAARPGVHELARRLTSCRAQITHRGRRAQRLALAALVLIAIVVSVTFHRESIADRSQKMEQALVRLAAVEAQSKVPGEKPSPEEQRAAAYRILEKELGLPVGSLAKELPAFALDLYNRADTTPLMRARAADALNKFAAAEKLSLEGAEQDRQAYESAQRVLNDRRKHAIEGYLFAGQSAQKLIQYDRAMEHFREAEKLTDRARNPEDWAAVQYSIGDVFGNQGQYKAAEDVLADVIEVRTHALGSEDPETLRTRTLFAWTIRSNGRLAEAEAQFCEVIEIQEKILGPRHADTLSSKHGLAVVMFFQGKYAQAEVQYREVIKIREKVLGPEHPDTLRTRSSLAGSLAGQDKLVEAEAQYLEIIKLQEKVMGPEHPDPLLTRRRLANTLLDHGKYSEAEVQAREVATVQERVLGPEHPQTLDSRANLARALNGQGKFAEAEALYREVITLLEKVQGPEHPHTLWTRGCLADAHNDQGKYAEAEAEYREVITLYEKIIGPEAPGTLENRGSLASALNGQGKFAEAEAEYREVITLQEKILGPESKYTLGTRGNLASALNGQGKFAEAEAQAREVITLQEKIVGPENPNTLWTRGNLAFALNNQGKYAEAEAQAREVIALQEKLPGPENPDTLDSRGHLANALYGQDKYAEGEVRFREVIRLKEKVLGPDLPETLASCYDFATGLKRQGKNQEAEEFARRAVEGARKTLGPVHPSTKKYERLLAELSTTR